VEPSPATAALSCPRCVYLSLELIALPNPAIHQIKAATLRAAAPAALAPGVRPWGADPARRAGQVAVYRAGNADATAQLADATAQLSVRQPERQ
jgi:hypothetical protein